MFSQTLKHLKTQTYVTSCDASKPKELLFGFFNWINYKRYHDHGNTFCQRKKMGGLQVQSGGVLQGKKLLAEKF